MKLFNSLGLGFLCGRIFLLMFLWREFMSIKKDDLLQRQEFVELIKEIINTKINAKENYTLAIDGKWGCGKTFVLNMIENQVNKDYLILKYNCWEKDYYEEPLIALVSVLIDFINQNTKLKSLYNSIVDNSLKEVSNDLLCLISEISEFTTGINIKRFVDSKKRLLKKIRNDTKIVNKVNSLLPLDNIIELTRNILIKISKNNKIIFIVDELDRCLPEYSIKVLERLHHISCDIPVVTILAINKQIVGDSICSAFGIQIVDEDKKNIFVNDYLRKFINSTIPLGYGSINISKLSEFCNILPTYDTVLEEVSCIELCNDRFMSSFFEKALMLFTKRDQEKILECTKLIHEITFSNQTIIKTCSRILLCCEILYVTRKIFYQNKYWFKVIKGEDGIRYRLDLQYTGSNYPFGGYPETISEFLTDTSNSAHNFINTNVCSFRPKNEVSILFNYFLNNFAPENENDKISVMITREREFLTDFIKLLDNLN